MSPELIVAVAAALLSLVFGYFPALRNWYESKSSEVQGGIMLGLLALLSFGGFLPVCFGWFVEDIPLTCDKAGVSQAVRLFVYAIAMNQGIYLTHVKNHVAMIKEQEE
jgi:hypothetical protein